MICQGKNERNTIFCSVNSNIQYQKSDEMVHDHLTYPRQRSGYLTHTLFLDSLLKIPFGFRRGSKETFLLTGEI